MYDLILIANLCLPHEQTKPFRLIDPFNLNSQVIVIPNGRDFNFIQPFQPRDYRLVIPRSHWYER